MLSIQIDSIRRAGLLAMLAALPTCGVAEDLHLTGRIVDLRGGIIQIRPRFTTRLMRVVLEEATVMQYVRAVSVSELQPGQRVVGFGDRDENAGTLPRVLMMQEPQSERTGLFAVRWAGVRSTGYGDSVSFGGTLKSTAPIVIEDDEGADYTLPSTVSSPLFKYEKIARSALKVGHSVDVDGASTTDGLIRAKVVNVEEAHSSSAVLFGEIAAVDGNMIQLRPRLSRETITIKMADGANVQREIALNPDQVKMGDTVTAQGRSLAAKTGARRMMAFVLMPGKQEYPQATPGGYQAMIRKAGQSDVNYFGKVVSLAPFRLAGADGPMEVVIPGQVPVVTLMPSERRQLKPGDKVMVMGSDTEDGAMLCDRVVIGASPIVGFGG